LESDNGIVIDYWQGKWGRGDGDVFLGTRAVETLCAQSWEVLVKFKFLTYVGISTQDNVDSRTNANVPSRIGADNRCHNHQQQSRLSLFLNLAAATTTSSTAAALPSPPPAQQQPAADAAAVATTTPASSATKHLSSAASAADHLSSLPHLQPQLFAHHLTLFDHHQQPTPSHQQQHQEQHNKQQQQTTATNNNNN
jgi:hypothetical protein